MKEHPYINWDYDPKIMPDAICHFCCASIPGVKEADGILGCPITGINDPYHAMFICDRCAGKNLK
jgi:hypothetical protein